MVSACDMAVSVTTLQYGLSLFLYHRLARVFDGYRIPEIVLGRSANDGIWRNDGSLSFGRNSCLETANLDARYL